MPDLAAQLLDDLRRIRTGHGARLHEMRERLALVDPELRRRRNLEALKLADLGARLRAGRGADLARLKADFEASTVRLADFDRRIVDAMIAAKPSAPDHREQIATGPTLPDPDEVASARAVMRARLTVGAAILGDLLPAPAARQLQTAVERAIRKLS
jgi:hypothetical protein